MIIIIAIFSHHSTNCDGNVHLFSSDLTKNSFKGQVKNKKAFPKITAKSCHVQILISEHEQKLYKAVIIVPTQS